MKTKELMAELLEFEMDLEVAVQDEMGNELSLEGIGDGYIVVGGIEPPDIEDIKADWPGYESVVRNLIKSMSSLPEVELMKHTGCTASELVVLLSELANSCEAVSCWLAERD